MFSARKSQIFRIVVEGYISTGQPIASEWVVSRLNENVSSATVRNELLDLERAGLLRQPHTSAGRVPTEEGYRLYIEEFVRPSNVTRETAAAHTEIERATPEEKIRSAARELSELAGNVVVVGMDPRSLYAIGMSHMYDAPESHDAVIMRSISRALDRTDEVLDEVFSLAYEHTGDVQILIGKQNPINDNLSMLVTKVATSDGDKIIALLGFMRMRYDRNLALLQAMKKIIEQDL